MIRYYRKYYLDSAGELLRRYLLDEDDYDWEFTALAAASLENYPSEETVKAPYRRAGQRQLVCEG